MGRGTRRLYDSEGDQQQSAVDGPVLAEPTTKLPVAAVVLALFGLAAVDLAATHGAIALDKTVVSHAIKRTSSTLVADENLTLSFGYLRLPAVARFAGHDDAGFSSTPGRVLMLSGSQYLSRGFDTTQPGESLSIWLAWKIARADLSQTRISLNIFGEEVLMLVGGKVLWLAALHTLVNVLDGVSSKYLETNAGQMLGISHRTISLMKSSAGMFFSSALPSVSRRTSALGFLQGNATSKTASIEMAVYMHNCPSFCCVPRSL